MGSELTVASGPPCLDAEAKSNFIFINYGTPFLWKITSNNFNETSRVLTTQVPWLDEAIKHPIDKLMGLGEIIQSKQTDKQKTCCTHGTPMGNSTEQNSVGLYLSFRLWPEKWHLGFALNRHGTQTSPKFGIRYQNLCIVHRKWYILLGGTS